MKKYLPLLSLAFLLNQADAQNYFVSTVGGNGSQGLVDGSATTTAQLYWPYGLAYDGDSVIYFSDGANHAIRKLNLNTSKITTLAGGTGTGLQDGIGSAAKFNWPDDVIYKNGFVYIADNMNNCIRRLDLSNNQVTTIAGTGVAGYLNGAASQAQFQGGNGIALAIANNGDIYVADGSNACVRLISNGQVTTVAGSPGFGYVDGPAASAKFHRPRYLALDTSNGDLFISDINNHVIRKLSNGQVTTFAGTGVAGATDGPGNVATFNAPVGIAMTFNKYLYVVDGGGNKLRKISPTGTVSTIAGSGLFGFQDGAAATAEFYYPQDVCYDAHCFIYMADRNNNRIRRIAIPEGPAGCVSGIEGYEESADVFYPNPSQGVLNFTQFNKGIVNYIIVDCLGHLVLEGESEGKVDVSTLQDGMYILRYRISGQNAASKLIIQK
jgi:hypothetical protein